MAARTARVKGVSGALVITICVLGLVLALVGFDDAYATGRKGRVVQHEYVGFQGFAQGTGFVTLPGVPSAAFEARPGERSVRITIDDDIGEQVRAYVWYDADGDGRMDDGSDVCGHSKLIPIAPRSPVVVQVFFGSCANGDASIATAGVIEARFFKAPNS